MSLPVPFISSIQNSRVKAWKNFQKAAFRKKNDHFFVEGVLECKRGLQSVYQASEFIICKEILEPDHYDFFYNHFDKDDQIFEVSTPVYEKLAYRGDSEGIIGIFKKQGTDLQSISPKSDSPHIYLIVENIEKPGNLGAILRTADAINASAIIMTGKGTNQYNPNVTRASLGTIFSVPVLQSDNEAVVKWAQLHDVPLYCAALPAFSNFHELDFPDNAGFVFGAEHEGLSAFWIDGDFTKFTIPMHGIADSLNLSVSVAVVGYEFLRRYPKK